jgi:regulator of replication initiation timing
MKKGATILLLGLLVCAAAFAGFYYFGTARCRTMMSQPQPELAWLKRQFKLGDAEFARITELHEAYLPQCRERCRRVEQLNEQLRQLLAQAGAVTPEIRTLLAERAKMRAECETEMLKHFLAVSRTMPAEQGQRYLAWVYQQTLLRATAMESRHHPESGHPSAHQLHQ